MDRDWTRASWHYITKERQYYCWATQLFLGVHPSVNISCFQVYLGKWVSANPDSWFGTPFLDSTCTSHAYIELHDGMSTWGPLVQQLMAQRMLNGCCQCSWSLLFYKGSSCINSHQLAMFGFFLSLLNQWSTWKYPLCNSLMAHCRMQQQPTFYLLISASFLPPIFRCRSQVCSSHFLLVFWLMSIVGKALQTLHIHGLFVSVCCKSDVQMSLF